MLPVRQVGPREVSERYVACRKLCKVLTCYRFYSNGLWQDAQEKTVYSCYNISESRSLFPCFYFINEKNFASISHAYVNMEHCVYHLLYFLVYFNYNLL